MSKSGPIMVFDSGIGGLSVLKAIRVLMPQERFVFVADDAAFPYGDWEADSLRDHVVSTISGLIETHRPAAVVIACNTASTLVLPSLRERFAVPFVGTVPAIKPAAEQTRSGVIAVLATPGTMNRDYTRDLIREFASSCHVRLVGAPELAGLAEARMRGLPFDQEAIREQIAPCFVERNGNRTDIAVLACTHYPFLADLFADLAPWPVQWLDPAPAIARRLAAVLERASEAGNQSIAVFTSGLPVPKPLAQLLASQGLVAR